MRKIQNIFAYSIATIVLIIEFILKVTMMILCTPFRYWIKKLDYYNPVRYWLEEWKYPIAGSVFEFFEY